jgi:uncharacterized Zn finger protein
MHEQALDGNAIAGALHEHFGEDMTNAGGICRHCGSASAVAELAVYARAPSAVARCRSCGSVVMVVSEIRDTVSIYWNRYEIVAAPTS